MGTFSIRWLEDGRAVSSKNAPKLVRLISESGLIDQPPRRREEAMTNLSTALKKVEDSNPYNVVAEQIWEDCDARTTFQGERRRVRVVSVGSSHAVVENLRNKHRTTIYLTRFKPLKTKGFRLVVNPDGP